MRCPPAPPRPPLWRVAPPRENDQPRKLCINCQWYVHVPADQIKKGRSEHQCRHPALVNPVDGSSIDCINARTSGPCGPSGSLFVERVGDIANRISHAAD